jgi:hypothetical protein
MHSGFIFLILCGLAALAWWLARDADRFVEEDEAGVADNAKAEAAEDKEVVEAITDDSDRNGSYGTRKQ